jgi:peptidyl-prolyl cis-trans isomerase B (cyclophilin B)
MKVVKILVTGALVVGAAAAAAKTEEADIRLSDEAVKLPTGTRVAVMTLAKGGVVEMELLEAEAPATAANFTTLCDAGFYDGIPFHRVVPNFVVQAGDATLIGKTNPTTTLAVEADVSKCVRGAVSMARSGTPGPYGTFIYGATSPNQFFILTKDSPHLDPDFCVFGRVVTGMDVVDKIVQGDIIQSIRVITVATDTSASGAPPPRVG